MIEREKGNLELVIIAEGPGTVVRVSLEEVKRLLRRKENRRIGLRKEEDGFIILCRQTFPIKTMRYY